MGNVTKKFNKQLKSVELFNSNAQNMQDIISNVVYFDKNQEDYYKNLNKL